MSRTAFFATFLLLALVIAGFGSYYASSHPDGLEFVAEKTGFLDSADDSPAADSPFADYSTKGIDDARLGGGLAGVVGCLLVLTLAGGLAWAVRRRGAADEASPETPESAESAESADADRGDARTEA